MGFIFIPLTTMTMSGIRREEMGNAAGIYNLLRNLGGSFGVAFVTTMEFPGQWLQLPGHTSQSLQPGVTDKNMIQLPLDGSMALDDMDKFIIKTALERANYNLTAAARNLGATRETLCYRVRKYNLKSVE